MKLFKRTAAMLLVAVMILSFASCSKTEGGESSEEDATAQANTTYTGTVTVLSSEFITITTEAGNWLTITITADTVFSKEQGGMPGGMGGMPTDGNTPPDMPNGDMSGMPDMPNGDMSGMPDMPNGDISGMPTDGNTPPDKPDGEAGSMPDMPMDSMPDMPGGDMPDMPEGGMDGQGTTEATIADISVGDTVTVTTDDNGHAATITRMATSGGTQQPGGNMSSGVDSYAAAIEITVETESRSAVYASTGKDENALHVYNGASAKLYKATITRVSADSTGGDNASFYGVGAAALVTDGVLTIGNGTIDSDAAGGTGVFAYGDGTAYVYDTVINTKQDTSGGIHVAGGGKLYAWDLTVETNGESSAAIRSDRGSGTMVVNGGTYTSNGVGSPAIYSAADITVNNAVLTAAGSEAICIEGLNSIRLFDCSLSGNMKDLSQNDCTWNIILYQSMSGDSQIGNSTFEMVGGKLAAQNGGMFYTTNTESTFILSGVDITYADENDFFLKCTGNSNQRGWGTAGKNGADCSFTAIDQTMRGDIIWDSISKLDFYALNGSVLTGAVLQDETNAGNGGDGYCSMYIDSDSVWVVNGNSKVSSLHCAGTIKDEDGNTVSVVSADGNVFVSGTSEYTVTVDSYSPTADTSAASSVDSWSRFEVEKP